MHIQREKSMTVDEAIKHLMNDWGKDMSGIITIDEDKNEEWLEAVGEGVKALFAKKGSEKQLPVSPCHLCKYGPPSSNDGKPCARCPARIKP